MPSYREQAIVLRSYKLGETDRIVHLFTRNRGLVRAVAKGVRRPGSRFGGRLEPFGHIDVYVYEGRNLDVVQQVELIEPHQAIRQDWARSAAASVMVELVDIVAIEGSAEPTLYLLLEAGLAALDAQPEDPAIFVDAFLLRAASIVGFHTFTDACAVCRQPGPHGFLSVKAGGSLCATCAPAGARAVEPRVVEIVATLSEHATWGALPALARERGDARRTASSYVRAFVEHHLDRRLRSYDAVPRHPSTPG